MRYFEKVADEVLFPTNTPKDNNNRIFVDDLTPEEIRLSTRSSGVVKEEPMNAITTKTGTTDAVARRLNGMVTAIKARFSEGK